MPIGGLHQDRTNARRWRNMGKMIHSGTTMAKKCLARRRQEGSADRISKTNGFSIKKVQRGSHLKGKENWKSH